MFVPPKLLVVASEFVVIAFFVNPRANAAYNTSLRLVSRMFGTIPEFSTSQFECGSQHCIDAQGLLPADLQENVVASHMSPFVVNSMNAVMLR